MNNLWDSNCNCRRHVVRFILNLCFIWNLKKFLNPIRINFSTLLRKVLGFWNFIQPYREKKIIRNCPILKILIINENLHNAAAGVNHIWTADAISGTRRLPCRYHAYVRSIQVGILYGHGVGVGLARNQVTRFLLTSSKLQIDR